MAMLDGKMIVVQSSAVLKSCGIWESINPHEYDIRLMHNVSLFSSFFQ